MNKWWKFQKDISNYFWVIQNQPNFIDHISPPNVHFRHPNELLLNQPARNGLFLPKFWTSLATVSVGIFFRKKFWWGFRPVSVAYQKEFWISWKKQRLQIFQKPSSPGFQSFLVWVTAWLLKNEPFLRRKGAIFWAHPIIFVFIFFSPTSRILDINLYPGLRTIPAISSVVGGSRFVALWFIACL